MKNDLNRILKELTNNSGVYKFFDSNGSLLYIGKAKNLKKRVSSYFMKSKKHGVRIEKMIEKINDIKWIETNNELEALLLENNLIKELHPKYNILLRDDKNFHYIKVDFKNDYPEIYITKKIEKDNAKYFGPKTSSSDVKKIVEMIKRTFKLCSVKNINLNPKGSVLNNAKVAVKISNVSAKRPCLDYYINRCVGPCAGIVSPEDYRIIIDDAVDFLNGNYQIGIELLKEQMMKFASEKKFEIAAKLRDEINAIKKLSEKQLISDTNLINRDIITFVEDLGRYFFNVFQIRNGKLIGQENFIVEGSAELNEIMESFLRDYYSITSNIADEILISTELKDFKLMESFIYKMHNKKVKIIHPILGKKDELILLSEKNARSFANQNRVSWLSAKRSENALKELQEYLNIENKIKRIEAYDISHLSGTEVVASMIVFKNGEPSNHDYRKFKLKTTQNKIDDYKSMAEVINRRLNYLEEKIDDKYKIGKIKKVEENLIIKKSNYKKINLKTYLQIKDKDKLIAFASLIDINERINFINDIFVEEKNKKLIKFLIYKLINKSKKTRIYLTSSRNDEEFYLNLGFEIIKKLPNDLEKYIIKNKKGKKKEIVFMAYQKKKKDRSFSVKPNLILIDGGKGQLNIINKIFKERKINIPLISLAKRLEEVFVPNKTDPINIASNTEASYLLQRIRDEAHRFAINYNREKRNKSMLKSDLDEIKGMGPKLKMKLLTYFGSIENIKEAPLEKLIELSDEDIAKNIKSKL